MKSGPPRYPAGGPGRVAVIGGGPAGMMAAGQAAAAGAPAVLLERTGRLGAKLRLTGNGRCNLTNQAGLDEFLAHFEGPDGESGGGSHLFLRNALARFSAPDLIAFFEGRGVATAVEAGGRVFPAGNDARQVVEALARFVREQGVEVRLHSRATALSVAGSWVRGAVLEDGQTLEARAVIVATGGASYPHTGSSGDGYRLAEQAGHTLVPIRPALVPLVVAGPEPRVLMGVSLPGVEAAVLVDGREVARARGDLLFTHYGVSGPLILTLSRAAVAALGRGRLELSVNLRPGMTPDELDGHLRGEIERHGRRAADNLLKALLPGRMAPLAAARAAIAPGKPSHQLTAAERLRLRDLLQDWRLAVVGHRPLAEAMVTAGGVDTREVDPRTLASRKVAGLYFAGEVLDVQAGTGGYNLQAAFSTGYVAGRSAAGMVLNLQMHEDPG